jgi:hypothetical protein
MVGYITWSDKLKELVSKYDVVTETLLLWRMAVSTGLNDCHLNEVRPKRLYVPNSSEYQPENFILRGCQYVIFYALGFHIWPSRLSIPLGSSGIASYPNGGVMHSEMLWSWRLHNRKGWQEHWT